MAFFVGLTENIGPISENAAVVFDRIVTNVGSAYDAKTGYFSAPINGTYQFTAVVSAQGRQKVTTSVLSVSDSRFIKSTQVNTNSNFIEGWSNAN